MCIPKPPNPVLDGESTAQLLGRLAPEPGCRRLVRSQPSAGECPERASVGVAFLNQQTAAADNDQALHSLTDVLRSVGRPPVVPSKIVGHTLQTRSAVFTKDTVRHPACLRLTSLVRPGNTVPAPALHEHPFAVLAGSALAQNGSLWYLRDTAWTPV